MFSRTLSAALHETLKARHKAVLMLNQRGFASFVLCRACGYVPTCPNCSTSLTYHERGNWLVCHHCGYKVHTPPTCPECGSPYLKKFGAGTQRVEAELVRLIDEFGDVTADVVRMDADTTSRKGAHEALLEKFGSSECAVLLGTQMIAKGLDFDEVTLVGVINADTQLRLPDFRSGERTFDLIEQVAGRAGRADLPGRVIVQTYSADSVPIRAAARYDRERFLADELGKRKALGYPPYVRLADVLVWGKREDQVQEEARTVYAALRAQVTEAGVTGWLMLPPVPCVLSRLRGAFRYHITVKAPLDADIGAVLAPVFRSRKANRYVNVAVDVDPTSML
jgi:primosomal protein N' (replication factor Y)